MASPFCVLAASTSWLFQKRCHSRSHCNSVSGSPGGGVGWKVRSAPGGKGKKKTARQEYTRFPTEIPFSVIFGGYQGLFCLTGFLALSLRRLVGGGIFFFWISLICCSIKKTRRIGVVGERQSSAARVSESGGTTGWVRFDFF